MTYIIAGKTKKLTFMMADCVVKQKIIGHNTFSDKVKKLTSSKNTFFSMTGVRTISDCVESYDEWLTFNNRRNDFTSGNNSINDLVEIIKKVKDTYIDEPPLELTDCRLFFISKMAAVYYDLHYDNESNLIGNPERCLLENNRFIDSNLTFGEDEIKMNSLSLEDYCKSHLTAMPKSQFASSDRFTLVVIPNFGKIIYNRPYKSFFDIIAWYNRLPYDVIDTPGSHMNI